MIELNEKILVSGNEAIAAAAFDGNVLFASGYPGTPSSEILEYFSLLGGNAEWAPNEKIAMEVATGAAYGRARAMVTMKHVGLNVAADPFFTSAYTGVDGALVIISADDPGMASSQNEQDNRNYAKAAGIPMLEPSDSQEAYDFMLNALEMSEKWQIPVMLRVTTRICHSRSSLKRIPEKKKTPNPVFIKDPKSKVLIPANAIPAHLRLREKLSQIAESNETSPLNFIRRKSGEFGIITSGISYMHAIEAVPDATILKLGTTYPLPNELISSFVKSVKKCLILEEGDPFLYESIRAEGNEVENKPETFRFGELNVNRVKKIVRGDLSPDPKLPPGKPPQLCPGCPHRDVFDVLKKLNAIVAGDIGCYSLGVLPPYEAMDTCLCMGAGIGVGLGLRHVLPEEQAKKVVSIIGDSTFVHSGITGIIEMVYNPPKSGHVVIIVDNETTAMTGLQEHPGTGRALDHKPAPSISLEKIVRATGIENVFVVNPTLEREKLEQLVEDSLAKEELTVIIAKRPCVLALKALRKFNNTEPGRNN
ncbi:MAG: thiamine pyrophosphate-binding protein [Lentisphaerae bacterium]|nr:thiamine pyrophosphate-binding protein [Lentisphaerota bacterium]